MGTRLTVVIDTGFSIDELQHAVRTIDEDMSGAEDAIAPENVTAWDVLQMVATGQLSLKPLINHANIDPETGFPNLRPLLEEYGGDMYAAFDGVVTNTMEPTNNTDADSNITQK